MVKTRFSGITLQKDSKILSTAQSLFEILLNLTKANIKPKS